MSRTISRRGLLAAGGLTAATTIALGSAPRAAATQFSTDPFTLGVASGDPLPDGVVLWTRLAPSPLDLDGLGGMAARTTPVQWQIAADEAFTRVIRRGVATARPELAHSVHVEVSGLAPAREYWYRFKVGSYVSPVGRTKTAPAFGAAVAAATFGFTSCQNFPAGYFTALGHAADDRLDVMLHLGDYIYEGGGTSPIAGRSHTSRKETFTLADYRLRHSQYKTDVDLQACHASTPFLMVPDDHEIENNWADDISQIDNEPDQDRAVFLQRRAAAFKALYEHMPLRRASIPNGPDMLFYRRIRYGNLVDFAMIDTRQYRDDQLETCAGDCAERNDPTRTLLGAEQEKWLFDGLAASTATWQVIGNQVITFEADHTAGPGESYPLDTWGGYTGPRERLYQQVHDNPASNVMIVTGDAHRNAASDLKLDFRDQSSATIGTEFLGTSVSSAGDGEDLDEVGRTWLEENPHIKFSNRNRGYQRVRLTPEVAEVDYRVIDYVTRPGAPVRTRATVVVEADNPGIADVRNG